MYKFPATLIVVLPLEESAILEVSNITRFQPTFSVKSPAPTLEIINPGPGIGVDVGRGKTTLRPTVIVPADVPFLKIPAPNSNISVPAILKLPPLGRKTFTCTIQVSIGLAGKPKGCAPPPKLGVLLHVEVSVISPLTTVVQYLVAKPRKPKKHSNSSR